MSRTYTSTSLPHHRKDGSLGLLYVSSVCLLSATFDANNAQVLFESDQDRDVESYVMHDIHEEIGGVYAPKKNEDVEEIPDDVLRDALDGGLTKKLLKEYEQLDDNSPRSGSLVPEYNNVILAVVVMGVGAKLDDEDRKYLRDLATVRVSPDSSL